MGCTAWRMCIRPFLLVPFLLSSAAGLAAAVEPLSVAYGPDAATAEGDSDYREVLYLSVPDSTTDRLYLRVYDADTGGAHDTRYGKGWDTDIRGLWWSWRCHCSG
jgi:hypothetical protein